jgi:3-dehydroquinate synthase
MRLTVRLGARSYPILFGRGAHGAIGGLLAGEGIRRAVILTQVRIAALHSNAILDSCRAAGIEAAVRLLPDGEEAKTLAVVEGLYRDFMELGVDRWTAVVALGGGVTGDTAGFAAGTWMRGVPFFQVPTTLVAQVDSSIGGKVAVNLPGAKNVVGVFHQPRAVLADPACLKTLPEREYRAGLSEVVRSAAIRDSVLFRRLEGSLEALRDRNEEFLEEVVVRSAAVKARIVAADEREERDLRALLNYGHSLGHAVEAAAGYGRYLHGEAVAIGMAAAARLACREGICGPRTLERQLILLKGLELPVTISDLSSGAILNSLKLDKKNKGGMTRFVLTPRIGHARVFTGLDPVRLVEAGFQS